MSECVTHHHACACREEAIARTHREQEETICRLQRERDAWEMRALGLQDALISIAELHGAGSNAEVIARQVLALVPVNPAGKPGEED